MKWFKKNRFNILTYLFCAFSMALFVVLSFSCKTYAYTINDDGNLVGDNILPITTNIINQNVDVSLIPGTYTINFNVIESNNVSIQLYSSYDQANIVFINSSVGHKESTFTIDNNTTITLVPNGSTLSYVMLNNGDTALPWEPYGVWYSQQNYDTLQTEFNVVNDDFSTLKNTINYGIFAYLTGYVWDSSISTTGNVRITGINPNNTSDIIYIREPESHSVFWSFEALISQGILQTGAIFDTSIIQDLEDYDGNYVYYFNFTFNHLPLNALYIFFQNMNNMQVVVRDYDDHTATFNINNDVKVITSQDVLDLVPNFNSEIYNIYTTGLLSSIDWRGQIIGSTNALNSYNTGYADARQQFNYLTNENDLLNNQINSLTDKVNNLQFNFDTLQSAYNDLNNSYTNLLNGNNFANLFFTIAETPFASFKQIWSVDFLGVNLAGFVTGILFIGVLIWVVKKIF